MFPALWVGLVETVFSKYYICSGFLGHLVNSQGIIDSPGNPEKALALKETLASPELTREQLDAMMKEFVDTAQVCAISLIRLISQVMLYQKLTRVS